MEAEARRFGALGATVGRYALAGVGPIAGAGVQFALSLLLLNLLDPAAFGSFSFLLVSSYFAAGLWSALFCAPLPALLTRHMGAERERLLDCLLKVNLLAALVAFTAFLLLGLALDVPPGAAALFALYTALFLLRWFARAYAYALGMPLRTTFSDLAYAAALLAGLGAIVSIRLISLDLFYAIMALSVLVGLLPFGAAYLMRQLRAAARGRLAGYRPIWREHSGWSLVGVVTTEATVNAHVYLVTALSGPAAYAPIAATALMIRPIGVAQNALTDFERARMAREIGGGRVAAALRALLHFRLALVAAWLVTCAAIVALFQLGPRLVFPPIYSLDILAIGSALWLAVAGVRLFRAPESALLQAAGAFRPLANASVVSCGFSVVAVAALLAFAGPLWSIAGIVIGELVFAAWTWRAVRRWRNSHAAAEPAAPLPSGAGLSA